MQKLDAATSSLERALAASGAVDSAHKSCTERLVAAKSQYAATALLAQGSVQLRDVKRDPGMLTQGGQGATWPPY